MKRTVKSIRKRRAKRDLFAELREGVEALDDARSGKRTLRTHKMTLAKIAALPVEGPSDSFAGREHDSILYPGK